MKTLYVIGNGFDIAHGLNTSYWSFREYLEENYLCVLQEFERLYNIEPMDFSDSRRASEESRAEWKDDISHVLWSEFENKIGYPNVEDMLATSESVLDDLELDSGLVAIEDTMNSHWEELYGYIKEFDCYVKEWIEKVNTDDINPKRKNLINSSDYFLNFNYTNLLENVYKIESVLHIHGGVDSVTDINPIMGHSNDKDIEKHKKTSKEAIERFDEGKTSVHRAIANYLLSIYKDTNSIINIHQKFWDKLIEVDKIVIIGWSAGDVDLPYLRKIRDSVSEMAKWYVYYYNDNAYTTLNKVMHEEEVEAKYEVNYISASEFWD